jgi:hypothetical protein
MARTALYCGECLRYVRYSDGPEDADVITWIVCDWCVDPLAGSRVTGREPAVLYAMS